MFELRKWVLLQPAAWPQPDGMQTYRYRDRIALDALELVDVPRPQPGPREVLVRVDAVSLNYRDLAIARDGYGGFRAPLVPASDAAGEVVAIGDRVARVAVGDRVIPTYVPDWHGGPPRPETVARRLGGPLDGVLREYLTVDEDAAVAVPAFLSTAEAATLAIAGTTAWQALVTDAGLHAGASIAVRGTGGVALAVVLVARAIGARPIVIVRDTERASRVARLGATPIDASTTPDWARQVLRVTDDLGVDALVDVVGGSDTARAIEATRLGGTVALVGFAGGASATIDLTVAMRRMITLRGASAGSRASLVELTRALDRTRLRPTVDRVFPFREARAAFDYLATGRPFGKVVIGGVS